VGSAAEIGACVHPRGRQRDFGCTPDWIWERVPNPGSEGNTRPEWGTRMDLNEDDTNVNGGVQSNVNLGFGSRAVGPLSVPRVKSSISDWDEFELASPVPGKGSRTEVETPPSKLALELSPQPSLSRGVGGGDTRSAFQAHVRVPDLPWPAEFRFSPSDVKPLANEGEQEIRRELPQAAGPGDLNDLSPESPSSDSGSCSTTAGLLSSRTEVVPGSGSAAIRDGYGSTARALRRRLGSDGQNEIGAGKTKMGGGGSGNELGGVGLMDGDRQTRRLSMISIDDLDNGGEFNWTGLGGVFGQVERCARVGDSQDWDALSSHCSSADADVGSGSQCPPFGTPPTVLPRSRHPVLLSDRGSVLESRRWNHVGGEPMGDVLSHSRLVAHQTSISGSLEAFPPLVFSTPPKTVPRTYDLRVLGNNAELNAYQNTRWSTQTHEHVHPHARDFDTLRFSSSSPSRSISVSASPSILVPYHLLLDEDKLDEDRDSGAGGSEPGLIGRLPLNADLRGDMKANMTPISNTRMGLNGNAEGALLDRDTLAPLLSKFINNRDDGDGSVSRHVDRIEHGDMGGLWRKKSISFDLDERVSPVSVPLSGVSGISMAGSLPIPTPATGPHRNGEDIWSATHPDSGMITVRSRSTDREEPEECGLLKSLLESSDPWGLMRKTMLNLPSPTLSEIERRGKQKEGLVRASGGFGRRGVGYVTPPSMDTLLGVVGPAADVEMEEVDEGGGGNEDSQEILDFRSSQPRTDHLSSFRRVRRLGVDLPIKSAFRSLPDTQCGSSVSGLPSSDFAPTSTTMDIFSDHLGFPSPSPQLRSYHNANHDDDRHGSGPDSEFHVKTSPPRSGSQPRRDEMGQPTRKRSRRSEDSEGSEDFTFADHDLVQVGERELLVTLSPSKSESDFGVLVPYRERSPFFSLPFWSPFGYLPPPLFVTPFRNPALHWLRPYRSIKPVVDPGVCLPRPSTSAERWLTYIPNLLPYCLSVCGCFSRCSTPPFCDAGLSQSLPENSGIDDVGVDESTLCHSRNDGRTSVPTILVPGRGGLDPSPGLGDAKTRDTSVTGGPNAGTTTNTGRGNSPAAVGFCHARKSRAIGSLPRGRSGDVKRLVVGSPATEQRGNAGNHQVETEEETRKDGKWSESGYRTATNTNLNINPSESDGGGLNSNPQRRVFVRNDRFQEGMYFDQIQL